MLQQTRVEAVIPYYHRFLTAFPDVAALAAAPEQDVLAAWSGLGYYSRARNLHRAAKQIAAAGFPANWPDIRSLAGVGDYTAAAVASISLGLPHAAVDGNVMRVISRLANDASEISAPAVRRRFSEYAGQLLDPKHPGDFNQAMMELGATVCKPGTPACPQCPVRSFCAAFEAGTVRELPVKLKKTKSRDVPLHLLLLRREGSVLLLQRDAGDRRLAGFWELPEKSLLPKIRAKRGAEFTHQIVNDRFRICVWSAEPAQPVDLPGSRWVRPEELGTLPLATIARKALTRGVS